MDGFELAIPRVGQVIASVLDFPLVGFVPRRILSQSLSSLLKEWYSGAYTKTSFVGCLELMVTFCFSFFLLAEKKAVVLCTRICHPLFFFLFLLLLLLLICSVFCVFSLFNKLKKMMNRIFLFVNPLIIEKNNDSFFPE